jgi:hypothetical protein
MMVNRLRRGFVEPWKPILADYGRVYPKSVIRAHKNLNFYVLTIFFISLIGGGGPLPKPFYDSSCSSGDSENLNRVDIHLCLVLPNMQ